jgi:Periplasmic copper-binding protein (NosD)
MTAERRVIALVRRLAPVSIVAASVLAAAPTAGAQTASVSCGEPVLADAVLDEDLDCSGDGPQLTTADVTLDLNGHAIRGSGGGIGLRIAPCDQTGEIVVENGSVSGFDTGIHVAAEAGCAHAVDTTITAMSIKWNQTGVLGGIDGADTGVTLLRNNTIRANAGNGISAALIRPFHVLGNEIRGNGGHGVLALQDSIDRFENNDLARNGGGGAEFRDSVAAVLGNRFRHNGGIGLAVSERLCEFKPFYDISGNIAKHNDGGGMSAAFALCEDPTIPPPGGENVAKHNGVFQCALINCTSSRGHEAADGPAAMRHSLASLAP